MKAPQLQVKVFGTMGLLATSTLTLIQVGSAPVRYGYSQEALQLVKAEVASTFGQNPKECYFTTKILRNA